jgi:hypothetical protein
VTAEQEDELGMHRKRICRLRLSIDSCDRGGAFTKFTKGRYIHAGSTNWQEVHDRDGRKLRIFCSLYGDVDSWFSKRPVASVCVPNPCLPVKVLLLSSELCTENI